MVGLLLIRRWSDVREREEVLERGWRLVLA